MSAALLTRKEVSKQLDISLPTLDKMIKEKKIKIVHLGNKLIRISDQELKRFIK